VLIVAKCFETVQAPNSSTSICDIAFHLLNAVPDSVTCGIYEVRIGAMCVVSGGGEAGR
jgi:hypothetical protein